MEFERSVYRIHERMLQNRSAKKITDIIFKLGVFLCKDSLIFDWFSRLLNN